MSVRRVKQTQQHGLRKPSYHVFPGLCTILAVLMVECAESDTEIQILFSYEYPRLAGRRCTTASTGSSTCIDYRRKRTVGRRAGPGESPARRTDVVPVRTTYSLEYDYGYVCVSGRRGTVRYSYGKSS
eukprot:scaffold81417_cov20-Prasinocladus_malaysianus.AAC.1